MSRNHRFAALLSLLLLLFMNSAAFGNGNENYDGGPAWNPTRVFDGGKGPARCSRNGVPNYWVNTRGRTLWVTDTDFSYQGLGPEIAMTRTHGGRGGMFGSRWAFSYESHIEFQSDTRGWLYRGGGKGYQFYPPASSGSDAGDGGAEAASAVNLKAGDGPVELVFYSGLHDRLLSYGSYWLLVEKGTWYTYRYDKPASGNKAYLTSISDGNWNTANLLYNSDGTLQAVVDAAGRKTTFAYDGSKRCTVMKTPDQRTAIYQYDGAGRLTKTTDLAGAVTLYTYDDMDRMMSLTTAGKTTEFTYNDDGIAGVKDARGKTTLYERWNGWWSDTQVTDPEGGVRQYQNNDSGTVSRVDALGNTSIFFYDGHDLLFHTDPKGVVTRFSYDQKGNLVQRQTEDPVSRKTITTTLTYDDFENVTSVTNPLGETWTYVYDPFQNLLKMTSPLGRETSFSYDFKGQLESITDPGGNITAFTYDSFGNPASVLDPLGKKTTLVYETAGMFLKSIKDARGKITKTAFDANGRLTKVTHPDGSSSLTTYDCCATTSFKDENGRLTRLTRDPLLNVTQITDPLGGVMKMAYDDNGNRKWLEDPLGNRTTRSQDLADRLVSSTNAAGNAVAFEYDANGNLASVTDERGKETTFTYNYADLVLSATDPLGRQVKWERDALGRKTAWTNGRGKKVAVAYDADGQIVSKSHDGTVVATYAYDLAGNVKEVVDGTGSTTYSYDASGRLTRIRYPDALQVTMGYDAAGNLTSLTYPGGVKVTTTYNSRDRISKVSWKDQSIAFVYDKAGNLLEETRANGVKSTYKYDGNDRMTGVKHAKEAQVIANLTSKRDAAGNTVEMSGVFPLSPTLTAGKTSGSLNDANQIHQWGGNAYGYDADGNLVQIKDAATFSAAYDRENRPTTITRGGAAASFLYDGIGNRVRATAGKKVRNFHHDHLGRLLFETDAKKKILAWYIHAGPRVIALGLPGRGFHYYHGDQLGSTLALTNTAGAMSASYAYLPFGAVAKKTGTLANPLTYVGGFGVMDEGDGLFFMKNRHYGAHTGKFLQKDPIGMAGGINLYAYVANNPVDRIDPEGFLFGKPIDQALEKLNSWRASVRQSIEERIRLAYLRDRYRFDSYTESWIRIFMKDPELKGDYRKQLRLIKEGLDVLKRAHSKKQEERDCEERFAVQKYPDPRAILVVEKTLNTLRDMISNFEPP
jgi:RHS repeat-associated protein